MGYGRKKGDAAGNFRISIDLRRRKTSQGLPSRPESEPKFYGKNYSQERAQSPRNYCRRQSCGRSRRPDAYWRLESAAPLTCGNRRPDCCPVRPSSISFAVRTSARFNPRAGIGLSANVRLLSGEKILFAAVIRLAAVASKHPGPHLLQRSAGARTLKGEGGLKKSAAGGYPAASFLVH